MAATDENPEELPLYEDRPLLPPRPMPESHTELPSPSTVMPFTRSESGYTSGAIPLRKPVLPKRPSQKLPDSPSYEPIQLQDVKKGTLLFEDSELLPKKPNGEYLDPKPFRKTHVLFGWDLGYWRMPVRHFLIFVPLFLLTFFPLYYGVPLGMQTVSPNVNAPFTYDCGGNNDGWSFVGLNIRFGKLSFGTAKALDLGWNILIGRGLQGLLSLLAFRVFQDALLRAVEMTPMSYELYVNIALYSTKIDKLWEVLKGIFRFGNWRTKAILIWIFISTIYLLAFPRFVSSQALAMESNSTSLMDAASGYDTLYTTNFIWPNLTFSPLTNLSNGEWRYNPNVLKAESKLCCMWLVKDPDNSYTCFNQRWDTPTNMTSIISPYQNCSSIDRYDYDYGKNTTQLYYWADGQLNTSWWDQFAKDPSLSESVSSWGTWNFWPSNSSHFSCTAVNNTYQFGFSFEWIFVTFVLNTAWLLGMWILWIDCDTNSELCRKRRRLGVWRAIADISEAMREELGPDICAYTDSELSAALKRRPPIMYHASQATRTSVAHVGLASGQKGRLRLKWDEDYGRKKD